MVTGIEPALTARSRLGQVDEIDTVPVVGYGGARPALEVNLGDLLPDALGEIRLRDLRNGSDGTEIGIHRVCGALPKGLDRQVAPQGLARGRLDDRRDDGDIMVAKQLWMNHHMGFGIEAPK